MSTKILIRFDDICPTMDWTQWERAEKLLGKYNVKPLLGVIPDCQDPDLFINEAKVDFWDWLKKKQDEGYTIAMHGYKHCFDSTSYGTIVRRKDSEFAGHPLEVQIEKIRRAKAILNSNGVYTDIFFAPAHSYDNNTLKALKLNGFKYISDGKSSSAYKQCGIICLPCRAGGAGSIKKKGGYFTSVYHAHEWTNPHKEDGYTLLEGILSSHFPNIVSFDLYRHQPLGNFIIQKTIERAFVVWQYSIGPVIFKIIDYLR